MLRQTIVTSGYSNVMMAASNVAPHGECKIDRTATFIGGLGPPPNKCSLSPQQFPLQTTRSVQPSMLGAGTWQTTERQ